VQATRPSRNGISCPAHPPPTTPVTLPWEACSEIFKAPFPSPPPLGTGRDTRDLTFCRA
jgi:hypothetical protein